MNLNKGVASQIILTLLLTSILALTFNIQPAEASGTIYIRADGSIDPPTAPISTVDNVTYVLTDNITSSDNGIVVDKDNIVIDGAGYTVEGTQSGNGTTLSNRKNVTIKNMSIRNFRIGFSCDQSANNTFSDNRLIGNNACSIYLSSSSNNTLSGNKVEKNNGVYGIYLGDSSGNALYGNNVTQYNMFGILLKYSSHNSLSSNSVEGYNAHGIYLRYSSDNTLSGNTMVGNSRNLGVDGLALSHFLNSIDASNLVNGKPIYYVINQTNVVMSPDRFSEVGYLGFVNCVNVTARGMRLADNEEGLLLAFTNKSEIIGNSFTNNGLGIRICSSYGNTMSCNNVTDNWGHGIWLDYSSDNALFGNNVANNYYHGIYFYRASGNTLSDNNVTENGLYGIGLEDSLDNRIFHNNLINNSLPQANAWFEGNANVWDNGSPSGGNYWSDYNGTDANDDGIGDTPYIINENNKDRYPLMHPYVQVVGDINDDKIVDIYDAILLGLCFNGTPDDAKWNQNADFNGDGLIDIFDAIVLASNYGKTG